MKQKYKKCGDTVVIALSGYIVSNDDVALYDYYEVDAIAPKEIEAALSLAAGGAVEVKIDSPGGNLFAGTSMYTILMSYSGEVKFSIGSLAGSAATIAAMASAKVGNSCEMSPAGLMFVHNVQGEAAGDYREMETTAEMLKTANKTAVAAYRLKTGLDENTIKDLMDAESWFSAEEALELKLIDSIMFTDVTTPTQETMASALTNTAGKLMNLVNRLPQGAAIPITSHTVQQNNDDIGYAQAALAIEQNRF